MDDEYPRFSDMAGRGEMIIPDSDGSAKTLLEQVRCILEGRGDLDYCPRTGELIIRTGLDIHMGGDLVPLEDDDEDEDEDEDDAPAAANPAMPGYPGPCPDGMDWSEWLARNNVD